MKIVASEIASIVKDLNNIFNTIKINNEQVSNDLDNKVNEVIQVLLTKITGIQTEVDNAKKTFDEECTLISNKLQTSANNSIDTIQQGISGFVSTLNTKAFNKDIKINRVLIRQLQLTNSGTVLYFV